MKCRLFLIVALAFLISSCGKEAAIEKEMESIAGKYVLSQYCINSKQQILSDGKNYSDLKAEVVKNNGQWYFCFGLPMKKADGSYNYVNVEQPISWSPLLDKFVVVGDELSFASNTGLKAENTLLYFDTRKDMIGLDTVSGTTRTWYHWKKK